METVEHMPEGSKSSRCKLGNCGVKDCDGGCGPSSVCLKEEEREELG